MSNQSTFEYDGMRYYWSEKSGLWYPSVTSFLSFEKKAFFEKWRSNPANAVESKRALQRGTYVHKICEDHLSNKPVDSHKTESPENYALFDQMRPYLQKLKCEHLECTLLSDYLRLGGRSDCIGTYNEIPSIIDFKGSKSPKYPSRIEDYFLQTTVYALAYEEMTGIKIPQIVILITCETGQVQEFIREPKDFYKKLDKRLKSYWSVNDFDALQSNIQSNRAIRSISKGD